MSYAFLCQVCDQPPMWRLDRRGDAVVSWACSHHLNEVCLGLQHRWDTEIVVTVSRTRGAAPFSGAWPRDVTS